MPTCKPRKKVRATDEPKEIEQAETEQENKPKRKFDMRVAKIMRTKGRTYKEIAEAFGTTEQRVKNAFYLESKGEKEAELTKRKPGRPPGSKNKRTIAEEKMLTNWEHSAIAPAMREDKAELNRAAGWFVTQCLALGQTVDKDNIESLYNGLIRYVELCTQTGMPMLVKTCQLALGLNHTTISNWKNGRSKAGDSRYKEFAELLYSVIGAGMETAAAAGSIDRVLTIWWEKAHFNMTEGTGVVQEETDPLGERKSAEEIAAKYSDLPD